VNWSSFEVFNTAHFDATALKAQFEIERLDFESWVLLLP